MVATALADQRCDDLVLAGRQWLAAGVGVCEVDIAPWASAEQQACRWNRGGLSGDDHAEAGASDKAAIASDDFAVLGEVDRGRLTDLNPGNHVVAGRTNR